MRGARSPHVSEGRGAQASGPACAQVLEERVLGLRSKSWKLTGVTKRPPGLWKTKRERKNSWKGYKIREVRGITSWVQVLALPLIVCPWTNYLPSLISVFFINKGSNRICFPGGIVVKKIQLPMKRHKRHGFDPWVRKMPWSRKRQPTLVFLLGKFHGQRNLAG